MENLGSPRSSSRELKNHFKKDHLPEEETLEALAGALKPTKGDIRIWFFEKRHELKPKRLSKAHRSKLKSVYKSRNQGLGWKHASDSYRRISLTSLLYKNWEMCSHYSTPRGAIGQSPEPSSQNDPGLGEAWEALKSHTLY